MDDLQTQNHTEASPTTPPSSKKSSGKGFWRELVEFVLIALVIIVPFRMFIAQPYVVNGASMEPTFDTADYLIVDQLSYRFHNPERGSVVVFRYPKNTSLYFIKRIIGLPGETVNIHDGNVSITKRDGTTVALSEPYVTLIKHEEFTSGVLSENEYFVMGDNRIGSADSRMWGTVPSYDIVGRPILQLFPLSKMGTLPGDKTAELSNAKE